MVIQGGYTSLMLASMGGHFEIVKYLVEKAGADVEAKTTVSTEEQISIY